MSEMQFQTDNQNEFGRPPEASGSDISGMLIKWGIASSRQQAEYVLIGIAVAVFVIAAFIYFSGSGASDVPTTPNWGTQTN
ncbi:hypothetical protein A3D71_03000 [Candidatus Kaiserbacteria bacterium RIFCSPHIGHO2_02_FULL_55_20]|uniref:Uncharacterized protein n=1 Tax=Candidatus Kaiserbacteria bacterium RIFCSPHIGHO2_02_FULL_55_20 TaxID=1798497 RepID=A0A1F6DW41_9BACT|nr:MAG: hypothetical protein A2680_01375 [Candidatus Kaiserbacteria bacterium RIFCSPHIGHO2_01_FULL_55_37]OGG65655.1 MAG: hypothetical protein A3D71_03000 [Candidatus Kaiserbacteria bacterium RIFCSPHIGHO2_02_FULL_55_20]